MTVNIEYDRRYDLVSGRFINLPSEEQMVTATTESPHYPNKAVNTPRRDGDRKDADCSLQGRELGLRPEEESE